MTHKRVYEQPLRIRWSHCDAAGIVYHPHYFTILNNVMEDFFRECGMSYEDSMRSGIGFPIAGIRCDFCRPSRLGDDCTVKLWIEAMGKTSVRFAMTIFAGDECRLQCVETAVCACRQGNGIGKCEIPAELREKLSRYMPQTAPLELRA